MILASGKYVLVLLSSRLHTLLYDQPSSTVLPTQPSPENLLIPSPHCLAYLPSLSQPSVVMLYRPPDKQECTAEGQRSARSERGEDRKRTQKESEEGVEVVGKKKAKSVFEDSEKVR